MKRLTVLRHAKSGWDDPVSRDFDRPLNAKGRRAAETVGRHLRDAGVRYDHIAASPAVRVVETIEALAGSLGQTLAPAWDRRVYLASAESLLDVVHAAPDAAESLLLVGHNPGLEELILMLVPEGAGGPLRDEVEEKFPTASVAEMTFATDRWEEIAPDSATLVRFVRPRDLDPALGPDQD